ncbi:MAG TPA: PEGA domain-containing protein, partial [Polyangia bacterium]
LEQQFGKERATRKKAIGQGTDIEAALAYLKLGTGTSGLAPANTDPDAAPGGGQAKPRVLWSTTIRRTPSGSRALSEAALPSTPDPMSASQLPGAPSARTSSSSGFAFPARPEPPQEVVTTVEVIDPMAAMAAAPGDVMASRAGEPAMESPPARRTSSRIGMTSARIPSGMTSAAVAPPVQPARPRSLSFATITLAIGSIVIGGAVVLGRMAAPHSDSAAVAPALGSVEVRSEPPGALIFIDGSPSGLVTPATLTALPLARPLRIQLSKDGFRPAAITVTPEASPTRPQVVKLVQTSAILRLTDLPRRASVFLDGVQLETDGVVETTAGRHELRVEVKSKIVFSKVLDLQAGEQITKVGVGEGKP